ncbi:MAG TPA: helix-turn-helix domain-containing protein [Bacteriovoracaceae bacterium]|nr:helix-turn-helix domain-containing protein [Bacteriovoracaceae bacterium]
MDNNFEALAKHLAHNLVELRQKRNLTQDALAKLVHLPRSTIANLESGEGNPSLINLAKLSAALSISIEQLLVPQRAICQLIEAEDVPVQERSQGMVKVFKLLPDPIPNMEVDRMELKAGAQMKGVPHTSGTKEYFYCLQGEITISVFSQKYIVKKGDVFAFPGEAGHSYFNGGKSLAVGFSVVVMAPVGV